MTESTIGTGQGHAARERVHPIVPVENYSLRAFAVYSGGNEPYDMQDTLEQKLWSVVAHEFGPNAADVLASKLARAVLDHNAKAGRSR